MSAVKDRHNKINWYGSEHYYKLSACDDDKNGHLSRIVSRFMIYLGYCFRQKALIIFNVHFSQDFYIMVTFRYVQMICSYKVISIYNRSHSYSRIYLLFYFNYFDYKADINIKTNEQTHKQVWNDKPLLYLKEYR